MRIDSHCHTHCFSFDGKMHPEDLASTATRTGLAAVVVTEHYEPDYPYPTDNPSVFSLDEYFSATKSWQKLCDSAFAQQITNGNGTVASAPCSPPQHVSDASLAPETESAKASPLTEPVQIRAGVELGYQPHLREHFSDIVRRYPFDSVTLSSHLFRGVDPYFSPDCFTADQAETYAAYIHELADMAEAFQDFDILAHYDYLLRYAPYPDVQVRYSHAPAAFDRLFRILIAGGHSLELNTRTLLQLPSIDGKHATPDADIYLRYRELGGQYVTLGSDAHQASYLGYGFTEAEQFLRDCGFDFVTVFEKRRAVRVNI